MLGFLLPLFMGVLLYAIWRRNRDSKAVLQLLMGSYLLRMLLQSFVRDLPIFSYGAGGDCGFYEWLAWTFAHIWSRQGIELFTTDQFPEIGTAALPINLFALIIYFNGDTTRAGCTAIIAFSAVMACYQIYRLACWLGADEGHAFKGMAVLLCLPGYLYYTSDMYKDGLVLFLTVSALSASLRLASKFSVAQVALAVASLAGLWYVRHYMVFLALAPLGVGLLGLGKGSTARQVLGVVAALVVMGVVVRTSAFSGAVDNAQAIFDKATNIDSRRWNQTTGASGVAFGDGESAFGALHIKALYTLFSPFPWQGGSVAMQMGKLDTMVWYYLFWRACKAGRRLWKTDRTLLLMFLSFLVPLTIAYAMTMANIGLILRQRMPIVYFGSLLGLLSWAATSRRALTPRRS